MQKEVKQAAKCVDVAARAGRRAQGKFRCGVFRRQHGIRGLARIGRLCIDRAGNAEIEQVRASIGGHEDIGWLDVAVDDQLLMGVGDGPGDLIEKRDAPGKIR